VAVVDTLLTESVRFVPVEGVILARSALSGDSIRVSENLLAYFGMVIAERVRVLEIMTCNEIANATLSDVIDIVGKLYRAEMATLADGIGVEHLQVLQRAVGIIEQLGLSELLQPTGAYHVSLTQGFKLVDSLARFFGVDITDDLGLDDALFARALHIAGITDALDIDNFLAPQVFFHVALADGIDIEPEQLLNMIWQPSLTDGIEFEAGYLAPDGSFTTWVMNTRSGAVTEYGNYAFNSFAAFGSKYLGASDAGLYELLGDDDDGEDIVSRIKGGFLQFGGTQLSRLKEAYIATTGDGRFVLKIRTKDGLDYHYGVEARGGRSTKFHMGKGQRSRYFGYELISAGQDFDLDTLEFVPLVVQRRV
jgi:hypothetical protein